MQLDKIERSMFLNDLGLSRSGLESLASFELSSVFSFLYRTQIKATYEQLGLQTYFTTGKKETRAWTIKVVLFVSSEKSRFTFS